GYNEVENISDAFNRLFARLQNLEDSRQEFVSNVSHELKTPITSIKVLSDSLLSQEDASAELYREFMVDIAEEIERENKIINDLLSLVKMDRKAGELNISAININDLLEQILKRLQPIANKRNIELIFESFRPVTAEVDEVKLSLAITNLIENAIKYNYDDGWVRVSLNADHKFFYVKVADSGVGIPEELQNHIFERFYRVDKARSRETGGTGLGLSITRNAILMHRGAIKVYSKEKEGSTFTIRVPLNYIA
ncbi:MAG: sensor histidine kinase, partial [Acetivibrio ethanolgignens]